MLYDSRRHSQSPNARASTSPSFKSQNTNSVQIRHVSVPEIVLQQDDLYSTNSLVNTLKKSESPVMTRTKATVHSNQKKRVLQSISTSQSNIISSSNASQEPLKKMVPIAFATQENECETDGLRKKRRNSLIPKPNTRTHSETTADSVINHSSTASVSENVQVIAPTKRSDSFAQINKALASAKSAISIFSENFSGRVAVADSSSFTNDEDSSTKETSKESKKSKTASVEPLRRSTRRSSMSSSIVSNRSLNRDL